MKLLNFILYIKYYNWNFCVFRWDWSRFKNCYNCCRVQKLIKIIKLNGQSFLYCSLSLSPSLSPSLRIWKTIRIYYYFIILMYVKILIITSTFKKWLRLLLREKKREREIIKLILLSYFFIIIVIHSKILILN